MNKEYTKEEKEAIALRVEYELENKQICVGCAGYYYDIDHWQPAICEKCNGKCGSRCVSETKSQEEWDEDYKKGYVLK